MTTRNSVNHEVKKSFEDLFNSFSKEELLEQDARMLAFQFLSAMEDALMEQKMSKKILAAKVGTSASYITQIFRGDRLPNYTILAKIQDALNIKFQITSQSANHIDDKRSFEFPEVEDIKGFWCYKTLKPNYSKRTPAELTVEYNETEAA